MDAGPRIEDVCGVCQDQKLHPVTINCGHVFCYKCIKNVIRSEQNRKIVPRCPTCRGAVNVEILWEAQQYNIKARLPDGFGQNIINGQVIIPAPQFTAANQNATFFWLYQKEGWWRYEERDEREIETAYQQKKERIQMDFGGKTFVISFSTMVQYQRDDPSKCRRIKRVNNAKFDRLKVKGVGGLFCPQVWTID